MMEVARTSETSVDNYFTWQYIPEENSELHTFRSENVISHDDDVLGFSPRDEGNMFLRNVGIYLHGARTQTNIVITNSIHLTGAFGGRNNKCHANIHALQIKITLQTQRQIKTIH
jgi:hypothetical protein